MIKKILNYKIELIIILIGLATFFGGVNSLPIGDDWGFIFKSDALINAPNPFVYWNFDSLYSRSWPLSYSVLWVLYKIFGIKYVWYKILNILLHIVNALILNKILAKLKIKYSIFITLLFLVHPMNVENIIWIFQIKTILSVTLTLISFFFLISYADGNKKINYMKSVLFFSLSLFCKSIAIFIPLIFFIHLYQKNIFKYTLFKILPFFLVSICSLFLTINGIMLFSKTERSNVSSYQDKVLSDSRPISRFYNIEDQSLIHNKLTNFKDYIKFSFSLDKFILRNIFSLSALFFYLKHFFSLDTYIPIYPNPSFEGYFIYIELISLLLLFIFIIWSDLEIQYSFFLYFVSIMPVLGYFYVPYMKYSYVADHWCYLGLIGIVLLFVCVINQLIKNEQQKKRLFICFITFFSLRSMFYAYEFNDIEKLVIKNIKINHKKSITYEYLVPIYMEKKEYLKLDELSVVIFGRKLDRFNNFTNNIILNGNKTDTRIDQWKIMQHIGKYELLEEASSRHLKTHYSTQTHFYNILAGIQQGKDTTNDFEYFFKIISK